MCALAALQAINEMTAWLAHEWRDRKRPAASFRGPIIPFPVRDSSRSNGPKPSIGLASLYGVNFSFVQFVYSKIGDLLRCNQRRRLAVSNMQ